MALGERVGFDQIRVVGLVHPRQRIHRQAKAHRRIAGQQVQPLVAQEPAASAPARAIAGNRQGVAHGVVQAVLEHPAQALALEFVVQPRVEGINVHRQLALAPQVIPDVFVAGQDAIGVQAQHAGQRVDKAAGVFRGVVRGQAFVGKQGRVAPARLAVLAPVHRQRPARQLLARIPFALAKVQKAASAVAGAQLLHQLGGVAALGRALRAGVPFFGVAVVVGDKRGLAAHGQPHIVRHQVGVHLAAQGVDGRPLRLAIRQGDARGFQHAADFHLVLERHFALVHRAAHWRGAARFGRAGQRNMAFAGKQARGRVQANPAGAGQVDLAPGVQVGEVGFGAAGAVQRFDVGLELDQIAGHKAGGQAQVAQHLRQQPARIAAGAAGQGEGFFRGLHARLQADQVADGVVDFLVERHQEVHRAHRGEVQPVDKGFQRRGQLALGQIGLQLVAKLGRVGKRKLLGAGLQKKVKGVEHRHLGHQIDGDLEFAGFFREHQPGQIIGERVLLPVDEVAGRFDVQRIGQNRRAAVRRGPQAHHMRRQIDQPVIAIVGHVTQGDVNGHGALRRASAPAGGGGRDGHSGHGGAGVQPTRKSWLMRAPRSLMRSRKSVR